MAESSATFAQAPLDPQQAMDVDREDSVDIEGEGAVNLPLTVFPPFEAAIKPTPSDVMAGFLNQLVPLEEVTEFGTGSSQVEVRDGQGDLTVVNTECDREDVFSVVEISMNALEPEPSREGGLYSMFHHNRP